MTQAPVSVVVVSRDRPDLLKRCLTGISQLQYDPFEVVVVADEAGIAAAGGLPFAAQLKLVSFDEANIAAARNLGITHATGEIVAFIDDDAVPEPTWLRHLAAPFSQSNVAAASGFVRGRNGISFQWKAQVLDPFGWPHPLVVDPDTPTVLTPPAGQAVKTEGTNMAVRRSVLTACGGFDPAYRYFLDETDLNMRLAKAGHATAIVPLAEVHHGFAANAVRRKDRTPRDLGQIGASWAVFHRRHVPEAARAGKWHEIRAGQRARLIRHMVSGTLDPWEVGRLMRGLDRGYAEGMTRALGGLQIATHPVAPFSPFGSPRRTSALMVTRPLRFRTALQTAAARATAGEIVTVLSLSPTALFHQCFFDPRGIWVQRGGLFGRANRQEPLFRMTTRSRRAEKEKSRVARQRGLGDE